MSLKVYWPQNRAKKTRITTCTEDFNPAGEGPRQLSPVNQNCRDVDSPGKNLITKHALFNLMQKEMTVFEGTETNSY